MAESEEELKKLLMRVKEESEKAGLKLNIQKTKSWLIGKDPDAGKDRTGEGGWGWDGWMASVDSMDMTLSKLWERGKDREAWSAAVHGVTNSRTQLSKWITTISLPGK